MVKWVAHRGASAEAPENSRLSIQRAIDLNADAIEIDIHLTKDNVPIAFHNPHLRHAYGLDRTLVSQTYAQLKDIAPHLFPTLQEILELNPPPLMLDIKSEDATPIIELARPQDYFFAFSDALMKTLPQERCIGFYGRDDLPILSINHEKVTPDLPTHKLWAWTVDNPIRAKELIEWGIAGIITNNIRALR